MDNFLFPALCLSLLFSNRRPSIVFSFLLIVYTVVLLDVVGKPGLVDRTDISVLNEEFKDAYNEVVAAKCTVAETASTNPNIGCHKIDEVNIRPGIVEASGSHLAEDFPNGSVPRRFTWYVEATGTCEGDGGCPTNDKTVLFQSSVLSAVAPSGGSGESSSGSNGSSSSGSDERLPASDEPPPVADSTMPVPDDTTTTTEPETIVSDGGDTSAIDVSGLLTDAGEDNSTAIITKRYNIFAKAMGDFSLTDKTPSGQNGQPTTVGDISTTRTETTRSYPATRSSVVSTTAATAPLALSTLTVEAAISAENLPTTIEFLQHFNKKIRNYNNDRRERRTLQEGDDSIESAVGVSEMLRSVCSDDRREVFDGYVVLKVKGNPYQVTSSELETIGTSFIGSYNEVNALNRQLCDPSYRVMSYTSVDIGQQYSRNRRHLRKLKKSHRSGSSKNGGSSSSYQYNEPPPPPQPSLYHQQLQSNYNSNGKGKGSSKGSSKGSGSHSGDSGSSDGGSGGSGSMSETFTLGITYQAICSGVGCANTERLFSSSSFRRLLEDEEDGYVENGDSIVEEYYYIQSKKEQQQQSERITQQRDLSFHTETNLCLCPEFATIRGPNQREFQSVFNQNVNILRQEGSISNIAPNLEVYLTS